ncbi:c-type cytochrome [Tsuneonella mangrovi]|uniref:c-type cytochrome n=1 Tax=Tsuneonella mangrovi TaxID=1982042 RepID=UPI000BA1FA19|nr:cytochrome c [Tsuneonella mangrovi]
MPNGGAKLHKGLKSFGVLLLVVGVFALGTLLFVFSGIYDVGADAPHWKPVYWVLDNLREHSVEARAKALSVPKDFLTESRISAGAGLYAGMCTGCHLAPGMAPTEISQGLYPSAPILARGTKLSPQEEFWVIKHGIKASGMAAWGKTHNDELIWDMVAFLQKLPKLTPKQYGEMVAAAPKDHDEMMEQSSDD